LRIATTAAATTTATTTLTKQTGNLHCSVLTIDNSSKKSDRVLSHVDLIYLMFGYKVERLNNV